MCKWRKKYSLEIKNKITKNMPKITKPRDIVDDKVTANSPLNWGEFVTEIINGNYVLLVGSEHLLDKQFSDGDSSKDILNSVMSNLKEKKLLGNDFSCDSFTELARETGRTDQNIRELITKDLIGENRSYDCSTDAISSELKNLLRTKFFKIVMTTTFDSYLENLMREIWGEQLRVMNIYGEGQTFDFDEKEQSADEFDVRPTLYYVFGKANVNNRPYVATDNDAIKVVARWMSGNSPQNFLKHIQYKGVISVGCKFDDWLFRFFWYVLRKDVNQVDSRQKDAVALSFSTESDKNLNKYLQSNNVYTASDMKQFIRNILDAKDACIKGIAKANMHLGGVFISYAHEDMPIVSNIVQQLNKAGFNVWFDSAKLESGDDYDKRIATAINSCQIFIPILSLQVKKDLMDGQTDRYYISHEWSLAKQLADNIGGNIKVMPLAINGYEEKDECHKLFAFNDKTVMNLMKQPLSRFINSMKS